MQDLALGIADLKTPEALAAAERAAAGQSNNAHQVRMIQMMIAVTMMMMLKDGNRVK